MMDDLPSGLQYEAALRCLASLAKGIALITELWDQVITDAGPEIRSQLLEELKNVNSDAATELQNLVHGYETENHERAYKSPRVGS